MLIYPQTPVVGSLVLPAGVEILVVVGTLALKPSQPLMCSRTMVKTLTWSSSKAWWWRKSGCDSSNQHLLPSLHMKRNLRGPPGGPPLPAKPGGAPPGKPAGGKPANPGGGGPPIPAAGPANPTGKPLPAGRLIPGPAANVGGAVPAPPGALVPSLAEGSAGGGPSTEQDIICVPRTMVRPSVRFSSDSTRAGAELPGAD